MNTDKDLKKIKLNSVYHSDCLELMKSMEENSVDLTVTSPPYDELRNYNEYIRMFDLTEEDMRAGILGCADGPASFNCTCHLRGFRVISADPMYQYTGRVIRKRIEETYTEVLKQTSEHQAKFRWDSIPSVEELGRIRMEAMNDFLNSYAEGKQQGRYVAASLPRLPFPDLEFGLALSSHFLFLYTDHLSEEFHTEAIQEMLRVSREVRVFPLLDMTGERSPYVPNILKRFGENRIEIRKVKYEFQHGGNEALIIRKQRSACA